MDLTEFTKILKPESLIIILIRFNRKFQRMTEVEKY
jgi:hypothetical protein